MFAGRSWSDKGMDGSDKEESPLSNTKEKEGIRRRCRKKSNLLDSLKEIM